MVQLLVLPHTVCDSSPPCGLHPLEQRSVPSVLRSVAADCHGLTGVPALALLHRHYTLPAFIRPEVALELFVPFQFSEA